MLKLLSRVIAGFRREVAENSANGVIMQRVAYYWPSNSLEGRSCQASKSSQSHDGYF